MPVRLGVSVGLEIDSLICGQSYLWTTLTSRLIKPVANDTRPGRRFCSNF